MTGAVLRGNDYRPDIDGLRAIAVLLVVAFHAKAPGFTGGFVGVDVFFVISGYLIFGIISKSLKRGRFTLLGFYVRRVNRIFPALIAVLLLTSVAGWLFLYTDELRALGKHVIGGATFVSNFILLSETGYFDSAHKPLLHLWSLAVEEQFYLAFPLIALIAWKVRWNVRWIFGALFCASFVLNVWAVRHGQGISAFYLPTARFWEILSGALLYSFMASGPFKSPWAMPASVRESAPVLGLCLLGLAAVIVTEQTPWPGVLGLLPVVGTVLIVAFGKDSWLGRTVLGNRAMVSIGLVSYPLYLWHWPLLVFGELVNEGPMQASIRVTLVAIAAALALVTYRLLELPIRFGGRRERSAAILLPSLAIVGIVGVLLATGIIPSRLDAAAQAHRSAWGADWDVPQDGLTADGSGMIYHRIPGDSSRTVALIGDSHAQQYWPRFVELSRGAGAPSVELLTFGGCPTMGGVNNHGIAWNKQPWRCDALFRAQMDHAMSPHIRTVVLASYWEDYVNKDLTYLVDDPETRLSESPRAVDRAFYLLEAEISRLTRAGKNVFIVLSNPGQRYRREVGESLPRLAGLTAPRRDPSSVSRAEFSARVAPTMNRLRAIAGRTGAKVIDPVVWLCDSVSCPRTAPDSMPMYKDDHHLRAGFVSKRVTFLDEAMR